MTMRRTTAAAAASLLLALAACGDDDDTQTVDTPAGEVEVDPSDVDTEQLQDAVGEDGTVDLDEAIDALGLDSKATAIEAGLGFEDYEIVDETTLRITMGEGSVDQASMDCMIGGAVMSEGETLVIVYPDGEHNCD